MKCDRVQCIVGVEVFFRPRECGCDAAGRVAGSLTRGPSTNPKRFGGSSSWCLV